MRFWGLRVSGRWRRRPGARWRLMYAVLIGTEIPFANRPDETSALHVFAGLNGIILLTL